MIINRLTPEQALASLQSGPDGLTQADAVRRLREFGPNRVEPAPRAPWFFRLLKEFTHFFAAVLWLATALCFIAEWSDPGQGMAMLGYAIIGVILVSGVFSFWQEHRVERTLDALRKVLPPQVDVVRDAQVQRLAAEHLVPGD